MSELPAIRREFIISDVVSFDLFISREMKYVLLLFVFSVTRLAAQNGNDSVFNESRLVSFPLDETSGSQTKIDRTTAKPRLFIFLSPDCPICRGYSPELNRIVSLYRNSADIYGIFPGKTFSGGAIDSFARKFHVGYRLLQDKKLGLSRYLQATVTPEVILLNEKNELIYKGAIDDGVVSLGKQSARVKNHYLADALAALSAGAPAREKRTRAVGCILNDY